MLIFRTTLLSLLLFIVCSAANAQSEHWQRMNGPYGGRISSLVIAPGGQMFALRLWGGLYRSVDHGDHWSPVDPGMNYPGIWDIAFNRAGNIFLATTQGVLRSSDDGVSWSQIDSSVFDQDVRSIAISNSGAIITIREMGIFRSIDNGDIWEYLPSGPISYPMFATVDADPRGDLVIAQKFEEGVFRSTDDGTTWTDIVTRLENRIVAQIGFGPPNDIYVIQEADGGVRYGLMRTTDDGLTWARIATPFTPQEIAVDSTGTLYLAVEKTFAKGTVYRSTDRGDTWLEIAEGLEVLPYVSVYGPRLGDLHFAFDSEGRAFFLPFACGVYRMAQSESRWSAANDGLILTSIRSIARTARGSIIAGGECGQIFRSTDDGFNWTLRSNGIGPSTEHKTSREQLSVSIVAAPNGLLFAGVSGMGVFRSTDDGERWEMFDMNYYGRSLVEVNMLVSDTRDGIYAGTNGKGVYHGDAFEFYMWRVSYRMPALDILLARAIVVDGNDRVIVGGRYDKPRGAIFRSTDSDTNWTSIGGAFDSIAVASLAIGIDGALFAGTESTGEPGGIFRSLDGTGWQRVTGPMRDTAITAIVVHRNGHMFAATGRYGWTAGSILRSTDRGATWAPWTEGIDGIEFNNVDAIATTSDGFVFAAVDGGGIYRAYMPAAIDAEDAGHDFVETELHVYPNPAQSSSTIEFSLASTYNVTLKLIDRNGATVATLLDAVLPHGRHSHRLSTTGLASGVYLCRLQAGPKVTTACIVVTR